MSEHETGSIASSSTTGNSTSSKSGSKGLARVGLIKKVIHSFISHSQLDISSLHISSPDESGLCASGKIRLSHLPSGPIPLVGLKVKFKDPENVLLYRNATLPTNEKGKTTNIKGIPFARVKIEPLTLQPGLPGSVSSEVDLKLVVHPDHHAEFVDFVKDVVRSDPKTGTKVLLSAQGVQVKVFGLKFGGLKLEKEVALGGLGCLGGALIFDQEGTSAPKFAEDGNSIAGATSEKKKRNRWSLRKNSLEKNIKQNQLSPATSSTTAVDPKPTATSKRLEISDLEIVGGDAVKGIQVKAKVTIENPAKSPSLTVEPGELRFLLCIPDSQAGKSDSNAILPAGYIELGHLALESMVLKPGPNTVKASGFILLPPPSSDPDDTTSYQYRAHSKGQYCIAKILQNEALDACAVATKHSASDPSSGASTVGWLAEAFEGTRIDARIPPLGERVKLLDGAELRVEGSEGGFSPKDSNLKSSVARATLRNSFGVDIFVDQLTVQACSSALYDENGNPEILELGVVDTSRGSGWSGLTLKQGGEPLHASLPMEINPDPKVLIEILLKSAKSRHVDLGNPLTSLLEELRYSHWTEAGWSSPPKSRPSSSRGTSIRTSVDQVPTAPTDPSDDLALLLSSALANLRVTAHVEAEARIGQFKIPGKLKFTQKHLPIALSTATATSLLPLVGKPFVKAMVDRAEVEVSRIKVTSMDDRGVLAKVSIRLVNFGPLSAMVQFVTGLQLRDTINGKEETVAVLECSDEIPVIAGEEKPVEVDARIAIPTGSQARDFYSHFILKLLKSEAAEFGVFSEKLSATSGGVQFDTSLSKSIILDGLGGFPDLKLDDFRVVGEASAPVDGVSLSVAAPVNGGQASAIQIKATTIIKNAGELSLDVQRLECDLLLDGIVIGQATLVDVNLQARGTVKVNVDGLIYPPSKEGEAKISALKSLSSMIEGLLGGEEILIQVRGKRAWVADQGSRPVSLAWLDEALRGFQTVASLQWASVPVVESVNVGCIEAVFPARGDMQIKVEQVSADYRIPFPINLEIREIQADLDIMYENKVMATCSAAQDQIVHKVDDADDQSQRQRSSSSSSKRDTSQYASGKINLSLQAFELNTRDNDELGDMVSHAVQAGPDGTSQISLRGTAKARVHTVLGLLDIRVKLGKDHKVKIAGLDGLRTSPVKYSSLEVVSANPKYIVAMLDLSLYNPSESIRVRIPDSSLTMAAYFRDAFLGDVLIGGDGKGVNLNSGPINLPGVEFRYRPASSSEPLIRPMLTQFLSGKTSTLSIRGHQKSSTNAALSQALGALDLQVEVKPIDRDILHRISVQLGINVVTSNTIDAKYIMKNPIKLDIDILHLEVAAFYKSKPFGTASKSYSKESKTNRLLLPAGQEKIENDLVIKLSTPLDKLVAAFINERGSIILELQLKAVLDINGFIIPNFEYTQDVPLDVTGLQGVAKLLRLV
jgi:hypothetical protein